MNYDDPLRGEYKSGELQPGDQRVTTTKAEVKLDDQKRTSFDSVKGTEDEMDTAESGAKRSVEDGKGRFDLCSHLAERRIAIHMQNGLTKYEARNWEKGIALSRFYNAIRRHLGMFMMGLDDEDHLAAAGWNIHCMIHTQEMIRMGKLPAELDDTPDFGDTDPVINLLYPKEDNNAAEE